MFDKLKTTFTNFLATTKTKLQKLNKPIKAIIVAYFVVVVLLVLTAYCAWFFLFWQGKALLEDLVKLLKTMVDAPMVAFVTFIATCLVDKDQDGIPDKFEEGENK